MPSSVFKSEPKGVVFPLSGDGSLEIGDCFDTIRSSLYQLLLTNPGERFMEPEFGVGIRTMLFESSDRHSYETIQQMISSSIERYEKRIVVIDGIKVTSDEQNSIYIKFTYALKDDINNKDNFQLIVRE